MACQPAATNWAERSGTGLPFTLEQEDDPTMTQHALEGTSRWSRKSWTSLETLASALSSEVRGLMEWHRCAHPDRVLGAPAGKYFCHDVRVVRLPRHGASCPVGIGVSCSADRQVKVHGFAHEMVRVAAIILVASSAGKNHQRRHLPGAAGDGRGQVPPGCVRVRAER
eukprot:scaffold1790_cov257-Pinguiococcus_pyrenoidosus.AAC.40